MAMTTSDSETASYGRTLSDAELAFVRAALVGRLATVDAAHTARCHRYGGGIGLSLSKVGASETAGTPTSTRG